MTWLTLVRREVEDSCYPPRCRNDKCEKDGQFYFSWVPAGETEGDEWMVAYCSLRCFMGDKP